MPKAPDFSKFCCVPKKGGGGGAILGALMAVLLVIIVAAVVYDALVALTPLIALIFTIVKWTAIGGLSAGAVGVGGWLWHDKVSGDKARARFNAYNADLDEKQRALRYQRLAEATQRQIEAEHASGIRGDIEAGLYAPVDLEAVDAEVVSIENYTSRKKEGQH